MPQTNISVKEIIENARHHVTEEQLEILSCMLIQGKRSARGRRWNETSKRLAVALHCQSPKAYRLIRALFPLPSVNTIRNTLNKLCIEPGFPESIFKGLQERTKTMQDDEKMCTLLFDEMAIKKHYYYDEKRDKVGGREDFGLYGSSKTLAGQALTFMIRSIKGGWKQALGYVFSKGGAKETVLHQLILKCISKLNDIGIIVKVIICDQASMNRKLFEKLGVTSGPVFIKDS